MPSQEAERVLVPVEHEERRPQHDRAVLIEGTHFPHGLYIYRKPTFAQRRGNYFGYFLRGAVPCGICDKN
jgi:hypothetical protein